MRQKLIAMHNATMMAGDYMFRATQAERAPPFVHDPSFVSLTTVIFRLLPPAEWVRSARG